MSIDIPRVLPVATPPAAALDDELRVKQSARVDPIPSDPGHPRVERRVVPERRTRTEQRRAALDLRARRDRRTQGRLDINA
ncbi:MAG: hypothetical protein KBG29_14215 [Pseudomonadales bacterium]|jgi:hypothetical protein|nr:hypothetical protein [Pseudomonadales bacterium]MBP9035052.1 hypothetical protein [Pseudomonadales bacterium]